MIAITLLVVSAALMIGPAIRQRIESRTGVAEKPAPISRPKKTTKTKRPLKHERQG